MTASAVTRSNMLSESWNNIYQLLLANVTDPTIGSAEFRKWFYTRDPDVKAAGFAGYPFIIIHPSLVDFSTGMKSVDANARMVEWTLEIEVVTSDRGVGNSAGNGASQNDTITDSVISVLNSTTNRKTLRGNSLYDLDITTTSVVVEPDRDTLVYRRTLLVAVRNRMKVSA